MAWFFTEKNIFGNNYTLVGENAKHISKVLVEIDNIFMSEMQIANI